MRVLIIGAGGHAQVITDILLAVSRSSGRMQPVGYLDDNPALLGTTPLGVPVLGPIEQIKAHDHDAVIVGIGDNDSRRHLYHNLRQRGEQFIIACHPSAIIAGEVVIGEGCVICAGAIVATASRIGSNVILNTGCTVDHHSQIDDHVHIAPGVHIGGDVSIGEGTLVGIGATIMPQRRVGSWSIVGAGALVHSDLVDRVVAKGIPAQSTPAKCISMHINQ